MKLGIIGGSGFDDPKLIEEAREIQVETPYGKPSSPIITGKISGMDIYIIARHGRNHEIPPTHVNNRANIYALAKLGCTHIIATTACGSLRDEIKRGDFVILDQFIDFTRRRNISFYDKFEKGAVHTPMADPFSKMLRKKLIKAAEELNLPIHKKRTVITIEGPRFSTRAESEMFRSWGADVINMSIAPEAILAREAELEYAAVAMSTDYDCWKQDEKAVTWDMILEIFNKNIEKMESLLLKTIENLTKQEEKQEKQQDVDFIKNKIRTIPHWPKQGVMFRDITTLLKDKEGMQKVIGVLEERYKDKKIDVIAGIESRGFIIAGALALKLGIGLALIRKPGKLPAETLRQEYELEYGTDAVEIHKDAIIPGQRVLLLDDLIATGGTSLAACKLIEQLGGEIAECAFIIDLPELEGRKRLEQQGYKTFNIIEFEGE